MRRLVWRAVVGPKDDAAVQQRLNVDVTLGTVQPQHATIRLAPGNGKEVVTFCFLFETSYLLLTADYGLLTTYQSALR